MMEVRPAAADDVAALGSLVERYWQFEAIEGFEARRIEALLSALIADPTRGQCWVAEAPQGLQGYLLLVFVFSLEHGGLMAEIDELFVLPEARSHGTGAMLLGRAERELSERGFTRLQLQLGIGNEHARRFYARHGFAARAGYELMDKGLG